MNPPLDICSDCELTFVTLQLALIIEGGDLVRIETTDGDVIGVPGKSPLPRWIVEAVEKYERERREPIQFDCERGRA